MPRFDDIDHANVYDGIAQALEAHSQERDWTRALVQPARPRLVVSGVPTRGRLPDFRRAWERL